jgi:hypothetical protein
MNRATLNDVNTLRKTTQTRRYFQAITLTQNDQNKLIIVSIEQIKLILRSQSQQDGSFYLVGKINALLHA